MEAKNGKQVNVYAFNKNLLPYLNHAHYHSFEYRLMLLQNRLTLLIRVIFNEDLGLFT